MKHVIALGCCFLLCTLAIPGEAEESRGITSLSLNEAIQRALQYNPGYRGAIANARAAKGLSYQSGLWQNPTFFGRSEEWPIEESFEESRYFIGVSQSIPFPGKKRLDRTTAEEEGKSRRAQRESFRTALVRQVRIAFYQALAAEKLVELSETLLSIAYSSTETAEERLAAGVSSAQEVLRAEIQAERMKNTRRRFARNLKIARSQLALIIGQPELSEVRLTGSLTEEIPKYLLKVDRDRVIEKHPQILATEALVRRAIAVKERTKLNPYPDITVSVSGGRREINNETLIDIGFSVPLPILDSSRGAISAANEDQRKAESELHQVKQAVKVRLDNQLETLDQAAEQVKNYRERLIPQSEKALRLVQTGFREGKYGFNDLLDTQRTLAEARIEYLNSLFVFNKAIAEIRGLTEFEEAF